MHRPSPLYLLLGLFSLLLWSCGNSSESKDFNALANGTARWQNFPIEIYADAQIAGDSGSESDLREAMHFWEEKAGKTLFLYKGEWKSSNPTILGSSSSPDQILANIIFFQNPWPFDPKIAGKTILHANGTSIEHSIILLNPDTTFCSGDCPAPSNSTSRKKLLAHELGHFIGLDHIASPENIMNPQITAGAPLDTLEVDSPSLQKLTN